MEYSYNVRTVDRRPKQGSGVLMRCADENIPKKVELARLAKFAWSLFLWRAWMRAPVVGGGPVMLRATTRSSSHSARANMLCALLLALCPSSRAESAEAPRLLPANTQRDRGVRQ